jgi:hypothetical protein
MDKSKITSAFKELRQMGYFARQNFTCCQSCGWYGVPEEKAEKAVFYHQQDNSSLVQEGSCHLAWAGNGKEIVKVLNKHGVKTQWDGDSEKRIKIFLV